MFVRQASSIMPFRIMHVERNVVYCIIKIFDLLILLIKNDEILKRKI